MKFSKTHLKLIFIIGFIFTNIQVNANYKNPTPQELISEKGLTQEYETLVKDGKKDVKKSKITLAIQKFSQAELIAHQLNDIQKLATIKSYIGYGYAIISNYGDAFQYYNQALEIIEDAAPSQALNHVKVEILIKIGLVYSDKGDFLSAKEYYQKAEIFLKKINSTYHLKMIGLNLTDVYNNLGSHQEAKEKLEAIKNLDYTIEGNDFGENLWQINYAETLFLLGETEEARTIAEKLYKESIKDIRNYCQACVLKLLSKIAEKNKEYNKAIAYSQLALASKDELPVKIEQYNRLAHLYFIQKKYPMVIRYKDSAMQAKDRYNEEISLQFFEINKVKLRLNEYQNEIKINQINYKNKTKVYWVIILGVFLLSLFVFLWQKNRITSQKRIALLETEKDKNERLLLKKQMDFAKNKARLKQENLKNKISKKNRELTSNALYNSSRIEILNQIIKSLEKIKDISKNQELTKYIKSLKEFTNTSESWKEFTTHFEKVNPSFLQQLKEQHPTLTKGDIRFLCYIYMNLGSKEISIIFNITPEASRKRKQRISDKLGLTKEEDLFHYIQNLGNIE